MNSLAGKNRALKLKSGYIRGIARMTAPGWNGVVLIHYTHLGINKLSTFAHLIEIAAPVGTRNYIILLRSNTP
jgi:hypothetical protein